MTLSQLSLWKGLWSSNADVGSHVLGLLDCQDKKGLRGSDADSRKAVNATVTEIEISNEEDLKKLPDLALDERFPNLEHITLHESAGKPPTVYSITDFAAMTLAKLPKLNSLTLQSCKGLPASGAVQALVQFCPQIESLTMPQGVELRTPTFAFLSSLTALTELTFEGCTGIGHLGLQQMASMHRLESLTLSSCSTIDDQGLSSIAKLNGLTSLHLDRSAITGATFTHLQALTNLRKLYLYSDSIVKTLHGIEELSSLESLALLYDPEGDVDHADIQQLSRLTGLTYFETSDSISDVCSGILYLPQLRVLDICHIQVSDHDAASRCSQLETLRFEHSDEQLSNLLPLRNLQHLSFGWFQRKMLELLPMLCRSKQP